MAEGPEPTGDNPQMTDPMAAQNQPYPSVFPQWGGQPPAEAVLPPNVDDPGENMPTDVPMEDGFQADDIQ